jgi:hypothetical protein
VPAISSRAMRDDAPEQEARSADRAAPASNL